MRWLDGITNSLGEFEQTPGDGEGQGSLLWFHGVTKNTTRLSD